jgi:hypothetical protein
MLGLVILSDGTSMTRLRSTIREVSISWIRHSITCGILDLQVRQSDYHSIHSFVCFLRCIVLGIRYSVVELCCSAQVFIPGVIALV